MLLRANPQLDECAAVALLADRWGIEATALHPLGSLQDQNFRVTDAGGRNYVLKVTAAQDDAAQLAIQHAAMRHLAAGDSGFDSPVPIPSRGGEDVVTAGEYAVRLLSWVPGTPMSDRTELDGDSLRALGALAGRVTVGLADFTHPVTDGEPLWDIRRSREVVDQLLGQLRDADSRDMVRATMAGFAAAAADAGALPIQVLHADVTEVNAVELPGTHAAPSGVLDFGDVMRTWRVGDVASTIAGVVGHDGAGEAADVLADVLAGYLSTCPLTEAEIDLLWPFVLARAAVLLAVGEVQHELNPDSDYAHEAAVAGRLGARRLLAVPPVLGVAIARSVAGLPAREIAVPSGAARLVPDLPADVAVLNQSVDADDLAPGSWAVPRPQPAVGRWGEFRMHEAGAPAARSPQNLHLGVDVYVSPGSAVVAPVDLRVIDAGLNAAEFALAGKGDLHFRLQGLTPAELVQQGATVSAGDAIGSVGAAALHVQLTTGPGLPEYGNARHRDAWFAVCPDPSPLLGVAAAADAPASADERSRRRAAHVAGAQHLYYDRPVEIVRGWRHYLYDASGRPYLDMINNIASVGHSHPRVTAAAARQFARLNTNSRFLYDSMARYAQRIAELLPAELGSVFLVNSGSEAADLALQLARVHTGRRDVIALAGAYHGWTGSVIAVSSSPMDRPHWRVELEPGIHVVDQPDPYRGAHGTDGPAYARAVQDACVAAEPNGGVAAYISEPLLGNQGGIEPAAGYLSATYSAVRAAGGLCLADEVQVGMGRTGDTFWAFEHEGVVPDILFTAKATGNGHPLGVVACRPEIAASFDGHTSYFSSTGGGPVSCEVGLAVLDVIRDEELQANARDIGARLSDGLRALAERYEVIGAVHGRGLYQGIDLVLDRETKAPAVAEAAWVSEQLRGLGVIMQPTGDAFNVLKVKPPLCLDETGADYFVDMLDRVLARGGLTARASGTTTTSSAAHTR